MVVMEQTAAEAFPALYRAILDGVTELEQAGRRTEAFAIRREATAAYSGAWGPTGRRRLEALLVRIERLHGSAGTSEGVGTLPWLPAGPTRRRAVARPLSKLAESR